MALAVIHVDGTSPFSSGTATSAAWTSTTGSLLVTLGFSNDTSGAGSAANFTDSKSGTWNYCGGNFGGAFKAGIEAAYEIGGSRGASHTVSVNAPGGSDANNVAVIEITGHDTGTPFDGTTFATASDATSPFSVTAGAAISGNQIAIYAVCIDTDFDDASSGPAGYTDIFRFDGGSTGIPFVVAYKINETGTPSISCTKGNTIKDAVELFATFKEVAGAGGNDPPEPLMHLAQPNVYRM